MAMMFQKVQAKKKRRKHQGSILQEKDRRCYLCMKLHGDYRAHAVIHEHHIYGGANRAISEENGFKAYLCPAHHQYGPEAVHVNNDMMRILQQDCQRAYERAHTREEFVSLIGRNFL